MALNERQKRFCDEYLIDLDATNAAIRAGYSKKTAYSIGSENLKKPELRKYIDERLEMHKEKAIADQEEVLQLLTDIARGKARGTGLVGVGGGAQVVEQLPPTLSERTRAAELLGKRYALWTDKQEVTQRTIEVTVGDYSDED